MADDSVLLRLSWEDFRKKTQQLAEKLRGRLPVRGIIAVTRGGLVPAAVLATSLDIRTIDTIGVVSYDGHERDDKVRIVKDIDHDGEGWLVVDDLSDSGRTLRVLRGILPKAHFATVYVKPAGRDAVDTWFEEVPQSTWIIFPWEEDA